MAKSLFKGDFFITGKILGSRISLERIVLLCGLKILADGQNVAAGGEHVVEKNVDLLLGFSEADHKAGFGEKGFVLLLEIAQDIQRALVIGLRTDDLLKLLYRFHIVIYNVSNT